MSLRSFGWQPDYPDFRDLGLSSFLNDENKEQEILQANVPQKNVLKIDLEKKAEDYNSVDLRQYCSPVTNQGDINACTAHAAASLIEYYENRRYGNYEKCSRLFLYKATRNYMNIKGDFGANPRSAMAAMVLFGVPPEKYFQYVEDKVEEEPSAFLYSFAQNYKTLKYFKFDRSGNTPSDILGKIKLCLANDIPSMCGFTVYNCFNQNDKTSDKKGQIPFPTKFDKVVGGHAISIFGYDNEKEIINTGLKENNCCKGAFLIKNSWGEQWGEEGYGWIPYEYFLKNIAIDCWSIIKKEWVDTSDFDKVSVT